MDKPSIGRIVHYSERDGDGTICRAAIVTEIDRGHETEVSLFVFRPNGYFSMFDVLYDEDREEKTWHWPERV